MNKPVFAILLGGFLGVLDGWSALLSAPEVRPMIWSIIAGSTFKGVVAGAIIGFVAQRTQSVAVVVAVGLAVSTFFAYLVTLGQPVLLEIILPGSIVGVIVGFATAKYPTPIRSSRA